MTVKFDNIKTGLTYHCSMSIIDPEPTSEYADNASSISFSVQMYEWVKLNGPALYRDALFSDMFDWEGRYLETEVEIYERKDRKHYYRLHNLYNVGYFARLIEGDEAYEEDPEGLEKQYESYIAKNTYIYLDATDTAKVYFPAQKTGFSDPQMGDIYIASDVPEVFPASNMLYGKRSKDGVITMPKNGLLFGMGGYYYFSNSSGKFRLVLPDKDGVPSAAADYAIELESKDITSDGMIPVTFTAAKDVAKIKYSLFEGSLTGIALDNKVQEVIKADDKTSKTITTFGEYNISPMTTDAKTGIYTLVACSYAADGTYKEFSSIELGYVKPGDSRDVNITFGIHTDDRFASDKEEENYSSENSFQYWIKGKDITHAMIQYFATSYYNTYKDKLHEEIRKYGSVDNATLKMLNTGELAGMVGNNLKAGTNYTLVIYAGNGYHNTFFTDTVSTKGKADIAKKSFYYDDLLDEQPATADFYTCEEGWIPVSRDVFDPEATGRSIRGNWKSEIVKFRKDGDGLAASGLFPSLDTNPEISLDFKDGLLYTKDDTLKQVTVTDSTHTIPSMQDFKYTYEPVVGGLSENGYFFTSYEDDDKKEHKDIFTVGKVHEDIIAFVDNRTTRRFWILALGGRMVFDGEVSKDVSNYVGETHADLILVRNNENGRRLIEGLPKHKTLENKNEHIGNTVQESSVVIPEMNHFLKYAKKFDIAHEKVEFTAEKAKPATHAGASLLELKEDALIRAIVR